jgi:hypothetical protein
MVGKKKLLILPLIILILIFFIIIYRQKRAKEFTDDEIIQMLKNNSDATEYMKRNPDFKIVNKTLLTRETILKGQNATYFKEIYQNLLLEDNRYLKIDLMDFKTNHGLISIIDLKEGKVIKVYGIILIEI